MNHHDFAVWYYAIGASAAVSAALFYGLTNAQVNLWLQSVRAEMPKYWAN